MCEDGEIQNRVGIARFGFILVLNIKGLSHDEIDMEG